MINNNKIYIILEEKIEVPENEGYEIENGLPDMMRDINLKLVFYLGDDDNKIKQVFLLLFFNIILLHSYLQLAQNILFGQLTFSLQQ
jgi:hypothetical protein